MRFLIVTTHMPRGLSLLKTVSGTSQGFEFVRLSSVVRAVPSKNLIWYEVSAALEEAVQDNQKRK